MKKEIIKIEYQLNNASINILWKTIGTPIGLSEWFADGVTVKDNQYCFCWEKNEQTAILLQSKKNSFIRFQWEEHKDTDFYFELKIVVLEITSALTLLITDFAEPDDIEGTILLWDKQIEQLRRKIGMKRT